jgi:hypothetical protein
MFFSTLAEKAYLEQTEPISNVKQLSGRKYSFQKLNQLSQGNNMLDGAVSNIDGVLWRDIFVSST